MNRIGWIRMIGLVGLIAVVGTLGFLRGPAPPTIDNATQRVGTVAAPCRELSAEERTLIADNMVDSSGLLEHLVEHPYRMLFYDGNFDMACGYTGTGKILQDIEWSGQSAWQDLDRTVRVDPPNRMLGYYKALRNLTRVLIVGAGHLVPMNEPLPSRAMLYNWTFERPLDSYLPSYGRCEGTGPNS